MPPGARHVLPVGQSLSVLHDVRVGLHIDESRTRSLPPLVQRESMHFSCIPVTGGSRGHTLPQPPQLFASFVVSTQEVPHMVPKHVPVASVDCARPAALVRRIPATIAQRTASRF